MMKSRNSMLDAAADDAEKTKKMKDKQNEEQCYFFSPSLAFQHPEAFSLRHEVICIICPYPVETPR